MKELSIKEKAKAYDEALKVLHKYDGANIMFSQSLKEEMFPELKEESKDERTRKYIINHLQEHLKTAREFSSKGMPAPFSSEEIKMMEASVAWLEKQSEKHLENFDEEDKNMLEELLNYCDTSINYNGIKSQQAIKWKKRREWLKSLKERGGLGRGD